MTPPLLRVDTNPHAHFPVYSRGNFQEVAPERISVMSWSLVGDAMEAGSRSLVKRLLGPTLSRWADSDQYVFVGYFGFCPYHNVSAYSRFAQFLPGVDPTDVMEAYFEGADLKRHGEPNVPRSSILQVLPRLLREIVRLDSVLSELDEQAAVLELQLERVLASRRTTALDLQLVNLWNFQQRVWEAHIATTGSVVILQAWLRQLVGRCGERLHGGEAWLVTPGQLAWDTLGRLEGNVRSALSGFTDSPFYEIAAPLEPWSTLAPPKPVRQHLRPRKRRPDDHREALLGMLGPGLGRLFRTVSGQTARAMENREHSKSLAMRGLHCFRQVFLQLGPALRMEHDWPWLGIQELLDNGVHGKELADERRRDWESACSRTYPTLLDFRPVQRTYPASDPPKQTTTAYQHDGMRGRGVSPGQARGVVFVPDNNGAELPAVPYVVVARSADADLMAVLTQSTGVVTGRGSDASHIAIIARSLGVPAVVGVQDWELLKAGETVVVDGTRGEVLREPD